MDVIEYRLIGFDALNPETAVACRLSAKQYPDAG